MKKPFKYDKKYLYWGVTALLVIMAGIVFNKIFSQINLQSYSIDVIFRILRPIIIGVVIAYVLNPLMKIYERFIFSKPCEKIFKKNKKTAQSVTRVLSLFLTVVTGLTIVVGLILLILPELYTNIERLANNMPAYIQKCIEFLTKFSDDYPDIITQLTNQFEEVSQEIMKWVRDKALPNANTILTSVSVGIYGTLRGVLDAAIGIIVSIYILMAKERYAARSRKILYSVTDVPKAEKAIRFMKYVDERFGGFLIGKIVDSLIIGVICFIACSIFSIPYALLVSTIVGVTNIIPFFGPFIGAIPSAILVLLVNPVKALTFIIIVLIIQQIDGNIIGPKILGSRTGLDSFGVMFAILFSGGLFGVAGMILGVPVFAVIFGVIDKLCDKKLVEKNLPTDEMCYANDAPAPVREKEKTDDE